ncbi:MAG: preprotein translocase subunit SecG [Omnitrophica bacterium RIFCSPHIGHO2_02_FULL_63_14]|nr:MAG: preprotein translocase subunit SecG [Omnitrophica bacterium RIFCSPHIGHO2_02_FULL_63_14]
MYIFLIIVHTLVCFFLIAVILLQAGRGGGLSEMAGGGQTQSIFGTQTNVFMMRLTEVCAVVFILTSLSLALLSTHRGKSLMVRERALAQAVSAVVPKPPAAAAPAAEVPAPSAEPVQEEKAA